MLFTVSRLVASHWLWRGPKAEMNPGRTQRGGVTRHARP